MANVTETSPRIWTAEDLAARFGPIPLDRICFSPPPGLGNEADVVEFEQQHGRLFELVDGVLVEKVMGTYESYLAALLVQLLGAFVREKKLGVVLGADGMLRLAPGLVRIPDVSFMAFDRWPHQRVTQQTVADVIPNLAVEVVSRGKTDAEMAEKLGDYFQAGVSAVWCVYPAAREVHTYAGVTHRHVLHEDDVLDGGTILPGFELKLTELFADPTAHITP